MRDSEVVAAVVAGDPEGLAAAYDRYAAPLYTYCKSMLREPADAADAVQDTFVIAASRLAGLRDRDRLRPWLYAVARNECRRRIRARATTSALEEAPEMSDEHADVSTDAEREELRVLLRAAVRGMNPSEQEVIELQLRQGLDGTEVADVMGISRNHAHALISRARTQLEICLGVLLVARTGRRACAALDTLLEGWDGQLTALLRKRLNRHVERCPVCSEQRRSALRPAMLLGLAPLAALPAGLAAPPGLREQVLRLASSDGPDAIAHRASVAARTSQFSQQGFPKPLDPPKSHWWQTRNAHVAAVAAAAVAVIAVTSAVLGSSGGPHSVTAGGTAPGAISGGLPPGSASGPAPSPGPGTSPGTGPGTGPGPGPGAGGPTAPGPPLTSPPGTTPGPVPSSGHPTSPGPTSPAPTSGKPTSPAPTTPPAPGTLSVSPATVVLSTIGGTDLTISAAGGPVSWSISEPSSLIGALSVSPSSGTLQAGQSATAVITVDGLASIDTTLTVNPGGHPITVVLGLL
jgi:RNA polymerase sigma factor (sigma-70 family)